MAECAAPVTGCRWLSTRFFSSDGRGTWPLHRKRRGRPGTPARHTSHGPLPPARGALFAPHKHRCTTSAAPSLYSVEACGTRHETPQHSPLNSKVLLHPQIENQRHLDAIDNAIPFSFRLGIPAHEPPSAPSHLVLVLSSAASTDPAPRYCKPRQPYQDRTTWKQRGISAASSCPTIYYLADHHPQRRASLHPS